MTAMRRELLTFLPFGKVAIHGDVHTGNVLVRRHPGGAEPVLIDWGRARGGSPLEDLSAWLQSLGYWEPQARRRHDTLISRTSQRAAWTAAFPPILGTLIGSLVHLMPFPARSNIISLCSLGECR